MVGAATHIKTSLYVKMANVEAAFKNLHQDLLDGCKIGDQKAQFQIYKLYYKAMYNTSLRIVNDTMEAEDIMQESFLSAFEKVLVAPDYVLNIFHDSEIFIFLLILQ